MDLVIAGLGSRFIALLVDTSLQLLLMLALVAGSAVVGGGAGLVAVGGFLLFFGYPVLFETLASGRTPGKMLAGLRVVTDAGGPVAFLTSAVRNVVRVVDAIPGTYAVGTLVLLATERNQRLGDLAAGTVVVRDREAAARTPDLAGFAATAPPPPALPPETARWDLSAVTVEEVATVRAFLERRQHLTPAARAALATQLAERLAPKALGPPHHEGPERFLELVVAAKLARR